MNIFNVAILICLILMSHFMWMLYWARTVSHPTEEEYYRAKYIKKEYPWMIKTCVILIILFILASASL